MSQWFAQKTGDPLNNTFYKWKDELLVSNYELVFKDSVQFNFVEAYKAHTHYKQQHQMWLLKSVADVDWMDCLQNMDKFDFTNQLCSKLNAAQQLWNIDGMRVMPLLSHPDGSMTIKFVMFCKEVRYFEDQEAEKAMFEHAFIDYVNVFYEEQLQNPCRFSNFKNSGA